MNLETVADRDWREAYDAESARADSIDAELGRAYLELDAAALALDAARADVERLRQVMPSAVGLEIVAGMLASDGHPAAADEMRQIAARIRVLGSQPAATDADLARLRRIETAVGEVLASGQARYGGTMAIPSPEHSIHEGQYIGDLVPAVAMQALREAAEGEGEVHSG